MKKRIVQVGLGSRAECYWDALASTFADGYDLVGFCDINKKRCEWAKTLLKKRYNYPDIPVYGYDEFEKMIQEQKPEIVIVTSIDRTHDDYIVKAMELGCDVVCEKPMTTDEKKAKRILDAIERTGRDLRVVFNCRYMPPISKAKEVLMQNVIGDIKQVHFEWCLDTSHGADYFRRWHRDKHNSGGLLVHKSTHHFDIVNFLLDSTPETVFAFGDLKFYGRENAEKRGVTKFYSRTHGSENAKDDPFAFKMEGDENLEGMYLNVEAEDGYYRDQSVFSDGISIEDTMNLLIRYEDGIQMSYSLNAYSPVEGYHLIMTGTQGRMELEMIAGTARIRVFPMFGEVYEVPYEQLEGAHGGADTIILKDIFAPDGEDPLKRAASHIDGVKSIMIGIAANKSINTGMPVRIRDLIQF